MSDYRAGREDVAQDEADKDVKVRCPVLALWGEDFALVGRMLRHRRDLARADGDRRARGLDPALRPPPARGAAGGGEPRAAGVSGGMGGLIGLEPSAAAWQDAASAVMLRTSTTWPHLPIPPPSAPAANREEVLARIRSVRAELDRLGVRSVKLFGSAARDEMGPESDIDVLVEFRERAPLRPFIGTLELLEQTSGAGSTWRRRAPSTRCWQKSLPRTLPMPRDVRLYLDDLVEACRDSPCYTAGLDFSGFVADRRTVHAILRNLKIAGETVKNLPSEMLAECARYPVAEADRVADLLAHAYHRVDLAVIWRRRPERCAGPRSGRPPARRRVPEPALTLDPITLAVIQAGLGQVCNEMDIAFSRAAFSPGDRRGRRPLRRHLRARRPAR